MNIAYRITLFVVTIFVWFIITTIVIPILYFYASSSHPKYFYEWCDQYLIRSVSQTIQFIYPKLAPFLVALFTLCLAFIIILYIIYYYAKYVAAAGDLVASSILNNNVIKEFIDFGIFPFFDNILSVFFPYSYGNKAPSGPLGVVIKDFADSYIVKIKQGDGGETTGTDNTSNPNLTDDQNKVVNDKYDKCIKDNTPGEYNGTDQIKLLAQRLNITGAKIKCGVQKITDSRDVKILK